MVIVSSDLKIDYLDWPLYFKFCLHAGLSRLWSCSLVALGTWLLLHWCWMSANFKPKQTAAESRCFLAIARFSVSYDICCHKVSVVVWVVCERSADRTGGTGERRGSSCYLVGDAQPWGELQTAGLLVDARGQLTWLIYSSLLLLLLLLLLKLITTTDNTYSWFKTGAPVRSIRWTTASL